MTGSEEEVACPSCPSGTCGSSRSSGAADESAHPGAVPALTELAATVGTVAIITGRPAADAVALGGLGAVPGLVVIGHYGWQRWQDGELTESEPPPAVAAARDALPG